MVYQFEGWVGHDPTAAEGNLLWQAFEPKPWEETDIDIKVTHSGVCGTDLHVLRSDWGPTDYPICVGHEIVGVAVRVGSQSASNVKVGDRVGVGAQSDACLGRDGPCDAWSTGHENYCDRATYTYAGVHRNGAKAMGGHATYRRAPSQFVFKIPDGLGSAAAATMLCAGVTTYAPLKKHGAGPGVHVGVVGLGGLGHFAILWAKALGVDNIVVISRNESKKKDAIALGADGYIAMDQEAPSQERFHRSLDLIISTISSSNMPLPVYLALLRTGGKFIQLGAPSEPVPVPIFPLMQKGLSIVGSGLGSISEIKAMLDLAVQEAVQPWIEELPMAQANKALVDMEAGKPRFRYVLVNRG